MAATHKLSAVVQRILTNPNPCHEQDEGRMGLKEAELTLAAASPFTIVSNEELRAVGDELASKADTLERSGWEERFRSTGEKKEGNG